MTIESGKDTLMSYIMKNCLWQFNSRGWDRQTQNENIIGKATQILCKETTVRKTLADRCYWAEAQQLVNDWECFPWLKKMNTSDIKTMMCKLKETLDYQLITNSLNEELKNPNY
ncbi:Fe-only nitrogenase subunit delta [Pectinatus cerevisiiphilus]|nr:Fe-only nitrogenase subunit delta [Pectinatus cerevisiiphilus]